MLTNVVIAALCVLGVTGCAGPAATPIIIYVTPSPAPASATIVPTTVATQPPSPTPTPVALRFVSATNGKGSGLRVVGDAAISFGTFSSIEGETARLVVKVKSAANDVREIQQGFPEDDMSTQTRVVIRFTDGRAPQVEPAQTTSHRIASGYATYLLSGWGWTPSDYAALKSIEVIALTRAPRIAAEVWKVTTDQFTQVGSTVNVTGSVKNLFSDGRFPPLITAVFLDAADRPVTYSVASLTDKSVDDSAPWTVAEAVPSGLATLTASVQVTAASSLDEWGTAGELSRSLRDILDGI